ncbi:aromatic acid exporter family protein [Nocardioides aestuarii]|uniref:FUSC family protein n=1 Tax=Nocardioides aestuarii TaxID=252231 RepID=A0ABW4TKJ9_9ACTN
MSTTAPARLRAWAQQKWHDSVMWNDLIQLVKSVVAAVLAWVLAADLLELSQSFLAPWSALLVVHATVYRSMSRGVRQVVATVVAVLLAAGVGQALGLDAVGLAVLLALAMLIGWVPWFGPEAITITTTALIVLTTGWSEDSLLLARLLDTGIGVAVGLAVNAMVWPPLLRHTAVDSMARLDEGIGQLLQDIGRRLASGPVEDEVAGWVERTRELDENVDEAWALVRQSQEAAYLNRRREAREVRDPQPWLDRILRREQALAEVRSMARTLSAAVPSQAPWADPFGRVWPELLVATGQAVHDTDTTGVAGVRRRLEELVDEVAAEGIPQHWPVHGALIINLRNLLDELDSLTELGRRIG